MKTSWIASVAAGTLLLLSGELAHAQRTASFRAAGMKPMISPGIKTGFHAMKWAGGLNPAIGRKGIDPATMNKSGKNGAACAGFAGKGGAK